jgi:archaellum component FlaC
MSTPNPSQSFDTAAVMARLKAVETTVHAVETSVQEIRFQHIVKIDAVQSGLGILYGQLQHVQQEVTGFRAEMVTELGDLKSDLGEVKSDVSGLKGGVSGLKGGVSGLKSDVSGLKDDVGTLKDQVTTQGATLDALTSTVGEHGGMLAEILRRLPAPAGE